MKNFVLVAALIVVASFFNACAPGYVNDEPARGVIIRPNAPNNTHVWRDGDWVWNRRTKSYTWNDGNWVAPRRGRAYREGHWESNRRGYHWVAGRWR
jgi:hypothetical protein